MKGKVKTMKIRVTKYNEVDPAELKRLFEAGAELVKSKELIGVCIGVFKQGEKTVKAYSDDDIIFHNVTLPLSIGGTYDCEIEIN